MDSGPQVNLQSRQAFFFYLVELAPPLAARMKSTFEIIVREYHLMKSLYTGQNGEKMLNVAKKSKLVLDYNILTCNSTDQVKRIIHPKVTSDRTVPPSIIYRLFLFRVTVGR